VSGRYTVKPKADQDLDDYADYLTPERTIGFALRFLAEAHETFALIAAHPNLGWPARLKHPDLC
jgi:plasmid stabilization system protein ParE